MLSNHFRDVACDGGLGSHSAVPAPCDTLTASDTLDNPQCSDTLDTLSSVTSDPVSPAMWVWSASAPQVMTNDGLTSSPRGQQSVCSDSHSCTFVSSRITVSLYCVTPACSLQSMGSLKRVRVLVQALLLPVTAIYFPLRWRQGLPGGRCELCPNNQQYLANLSLNSLSLFHIVKPCPQTP